MAEETDAEFLERLRKENNVGMSNTDRARLLAQGAALGFGDEVEAAVRALSPTVTYEEALEEIRRSISTAKKSFPGQAAALEIGGALIPGLAAAPFTGGGSLLPTLGRAAAIGAVEGGIYGLGTGEGVEGKLTEGAKGAVTGAILNPVVQKGMKLVTGGAQGLSNYLRSKLGSKLAKPVQDEVMRIVEGSGLSVDEILMRIRNGEIFPDMSESALTELRGYAAQGGKGQEIISDKLRERSGRLRTDVVETLQSDLVPNIPDGNITMAFNKSVKELEEAESAAYKQIFADSMPMGGNSVTAVSSTVRDALQDFTQLRTMVNGILKAKRLPPVFLVKDKKVELVRALDLETVEVIRRALKDKVKQSYDTGSGTLGSALDAREKELRAFIDEYSPELAATREQWRKISKSKELFDEGKKILNANPEELAERLSRLNEDEITALRAGFAASLKYKAGKNARQSLVNKLDDIRGNERLILESLYPDEAFDSIADKILKSRQAFTTEGQTLRGSMTPFTQQAVKRQGSGANLSDLADVLTSTTMGNVSGAAYSSARIVRRTLGKEAAALNEDQIAEISRILVTEDPSLFSNAVKNVEGREKLIATILKITRSVAGGLGTAAIVAGDEVVGDTIGNISNAMVSSASAGELPQVDLPNPYGTDNPLLYDQETGESYLNQSPALKSLIETTNPSVLNEAR